MHLSLQQMRIETFSKGEKGWSGILVIGVRFPYVLYCRKKLCWRRVWQVHPSDKSIEGILLASLNEDNMRQVAICLSARVWKRNQYRRRSMYWWHIRLYWICRTSVVLHVGRVVARVVSWVMQIEVVSSHFHKYKIEAPINQVHSP